MRRAAVLAVALALAVAAPGGPAALASPDRDDLAAAQERLNELEAEVSLAVERYNQATERLHRAEATIAEAQAEVGRLSDEIDAGQDRVSTVVRGLYRGSSVAAPLATFDAAEAEEVSRRAGYLLAAQRGQQQVLEHHRAAYTARAVEQQRLADARDEAAAVEAGLAEQAESIEARLAAQEGEVSELRQRVAAAEEAEQQRRERRRAQEEQEADDADDGPVERVAEATGRAAERVNRGDGGGEQEQEAAAPAASGAAQQAVDAAMSQIGKPYEWGATGPDSYDCSGLTQWAWRQAGVEIPRSSRAQYAGLPNVSRSEIRPGDLLFFGDPIHHMGMYIGGGQMVEAPYSGMTVRTRSIDRSDYAGAARPR